MRLGLDFQPGLKVQGEVMQEGHSDRMRVDIWGTAHRVSPAISGRTNRSDFPVPGSKVQADGSYSLDLLEESAGRTILTRQPAGITSAVQVSPRLQQAGWGPGDYYMLETDASGALIVEPGRNHRKLHITRGAHGWTKARIAVHAGVTEAAVTNAWLLERPQYGAVDKPLEAVFGASFWRTVTEANSWWLLLERGYDYTGVIPRPNPGMRGESPLHPMVIGAWGVGAAPIGGGTGTTNYHYSHVVIRDMLDVSGSPMAGWNWLIADCETTKGSNCNSSSEGMDGLTYYRLINRDNVKSAPSNGVSWGAREHTGGSFFYNVNGLLLWQCLYDHNGWGEGYSPTLQWNNGEFPQPPNALSQNIYIQWNNRDVGTFENVSARAASCGQQLRPGGYSVDNLFIDNDVQCSDLGGDYKGRGPNGNWSLHYGIIATSAGYKVAEGNPALSWGIDIRNPRHLSIVDSMILHRANPADPAEVARKEKARFDVQPGAVTPHFYNNTVTYQWGPENKNIDGLDTKTLNQTTLQRYAAQKLGAGKGSIPIYLEHLRMLSPAARKAELKSLRAYFRAAIAPKLTDTNPMARSASAICDFYPDPRGEGFRWDVRLNWSTKDIPGVAHADDVHFHGNRVRLARCTVRVASISYGGGKLEVSSGKITASAQSDVADVTVYNCGQFDGPAAAGQYRARGGRLVLRPAAAAFGLHVSGDAECLLGSPKAGEAQALALAAGQTLRIDGGQCFVGWDGTGSRTLTLNGTLDIRSTPIIAVARDHISPRYKEGWPLVGETSGFRGTLDCLQYNSPNSSAAWHVAIRDIEGMPVIGESMVARLAAVGSDSGAEEDEGDESTLPTFSTRIPRPAAILPATLPCIRKFKSGMNGDVAPGVTTTVNLAGPLKLRLNGVAAGRYPLIEADTINGSFTSVDIAALPAGLTAKVEKTATTVTLVVS